MIKNCIKRVLYSCVGLSVQDQAICVYKTILFNFFAFGIKGVFKMPVYIYHNTKIYQVGKIVLHCHMTRGIFKIGQLDLKSHGVTKFKNSGVMELWGPTRIEGCSIFENDGLVEFHGYNRIADGSLVVIREKLVLGEQSRIGFQSFIMDSDDHYTIDVETKKIVKNKKGIVIGKYNWIASRTCIKKGVVTPDYMIVASANALLTKDYSELPPYSVVGGCPAKLLKIGIRRIYNEEHERFLKDFFTHQNMDYYDLSNDDIDSFCKEYK